MKKLLAMVLMLALASGMALAQETYTTDFEDGTSTVLGLYGTGAPPMIVSNVMAPDPVYMGLHSLRLEDNSPSGTPQAFMGWVRGLQNGDVITAGFWRFDDSPGASPSVRIWGHWNDDPSDITGYAGSAGGNGEYGDGLGWDWHEWTWTVEGDHTGLIIEARTYSSEGHTSWIDDFTVTIPSRDGIELLMPHADEPVATQDATISHIKALY